MVSLNTGSNTNYTNYTNYTNKNDETLKSENTNQSSKEEGISYEELKQILKLPNQNPTEEEMKFLEQEMMKVIEVAFKKDKTLNNDKSLIKQKASEYFETIKSDKDEFQFMINVFVLVDNWGHFGSHDVKEVEGSISQRIREGTLTDDEKEMLNELPAEDYIPQGVNFLDVHKEEADLEKTLTSVSEFVKIWKAKKAERKKQSDDKTKQFLDEIRNQVQQTTNNQNTSINSTSTTKDNQTQEKQKTKTFKPIQGESKNKTYTNNYMNETLKKLLENKFNEKQLLEMLFGIKSNDDDTNNVNFRKIISQMGLNNIKGVDIKA